MHNGNKYEEFCTGCGLCGSVHSVKFKKDEKGFPFPILNDSIIDDFCKMVCPVGGRAVNYFLNGELWGESKAVFSGWSRNNNIRKKASSGGVITSLCIYLLKNNIVDGVIQTKADKDSPWMTETVVNYTEKDVLECAGSRYSISQPLLNIKNLIEDGKKYVFVGKPCDVSTLRLYLKEDSRMAEKIVLLLSFFCAGQPSENANLNLIKKLGCESPEDCVTLQYRGNGWPGYATVDTVYGKCFKMTYDDSWGKILGRDVRKCCRFCIDGIGEMADISCGDLWYLNENETPDFEEHEGRNVIFARTDIGKSILKKMKVDDELFLEEYDSKNELKLVQKYQLERKAGMLSMIIAMKLFGKLYPDYHYTVLLKYSKFKSFKFKVKRFLGTCKRCINSKI